MPFVRRDAQGNITAVFAQPEEGATEEMPFNAPEIAAFIGLATDSGRWNESDLQLTRVIEDLVDVLIEKNVIAFTDLPLPAQQKLMVRHGKRHDLGYIAKLFPTDGDDDELIETL